MAYDDVEKKFGRSVRDRTLQVHGRYRVPALLSTTRDSSRSNWESSNELRSSRTYAMRDRSPSKVEANSP